MTTFSNFTYEELTIGQTASMTRQVTADVSKHLRLLPMTTTLRISIMSMPSRASLKA